MTNITNLPLDIWFLITDHLALIHLTSIHHAFFSIHGIPSIIKRQAIKIISAQLTTGIPTICPNFAYIDVCYRSPCKYPSAEHSHQEDGPQNRPWDDPILLPIVKYSRIFHQDSIDETEMIVSAHYDKIIEDKRVQGISYDSTKATVDELLSVTVVFTPTDSSGALCLEFNTLSENNDDIFRNISSLQFQKRTIAHHLPLQSAFWMYASGKFCPLPIDWFMFVGPGISTRSTFSSGLLSPIFPSSEPCSRRQMSFEFEWTLTVPLSADSQTSKTVNQ